MKGKEKASLGQASFMRVRSKLHTIPSACCCWILWAELHPSQNSYAEVLTSVSQNVTLFFFLFNWRLITLQCCGGFCHTFTCIRHGCTCVPHPDPPSHLPPRPIPQGYPSAPALSTLPLASNLDCQSISHMIIYMFQCYSLKSSHPCLLPQSPNVYNLHLFLFHCLPI